MTATRQTDSEQQDNGSVLEVRRVPAEHFTVFTITRPKVRNALSSEWWQEWTDAVTRFNADDEMYVGILTGTGKAFSAGRDLKELAGLKPEQVAASGPTDEQRQLCSRSPKPFICAVNGVAAGAGVERALDCDIRLASSNATFRLPEPRWGMVAATAVHLLPAAVGLGNALYLLLSAEEIDAATALRIGLVQEVVEQDNLMERAETLARQIAALNPAAVSATKQIATLHRRSISDEAVSRLASLRSHDDNATSVREASKFASGRSTSDGK